MTHANGLRGVLALLLVMAVGPTLAQVPTLQGWTLLMVDDFNGAAGHGPDAAHWTVDLGHHYAGGPLNWGTQEIESYTADPANLALDGLGHLAITPLRDAQGQWTSGRIESKAVFKPAAGHILRIEARIQMPGVTGAAALGYWPAFWALGSSFRTDGAWPGAGEFDVMENVNGLDSVWGILHCGVYPLGPCGEPNGIGSRVPCPNTTCYGEFHTYTFEWDRRTYPEELRWSVDGQPANRVSQTMLPEATWTALTAQDGYFVLLNVAMGGGFSYIMAGGVPTPTATTEPGHPMVVDYVGVWTQGKVAGPRDAKTPASQP